MEETLKKLLYTGVGLAATASEKIQATVQDLVDKTNLPTDEDNEVVEDLNENTAELKEIEELKLKEDLDTITSNFDNTQQNEVDEMNNKVKDLEAKLAKYNKADNKSLTKSKKKINTK